MKSGITQGSVTSPTSWDIIVETITEEDEDEDDAPPPNNYLPTPTLNSVTEDTHRIDDDDDNPLGYEEADTTTIVDADEPLSSTSPLDPPIPTTAHGSPDSAGTLNEGTPPNTQAMEFLNSGFLAEAESLIQAFTALKRKYGAQPTQEKRRRCETDHLETNCPPRHRSTSLST